MSQDIRGISARATEILLSRIKEELKSGYRWLDPAKLVIRETTAAPFSQLINFLAAKAAKIDPFDELCRKLCQFGNLFLR